MRHKQWFFKLLATLLLLLTFLFTLAFIVDPYGVTPYNLLHIRYKSVETVRKEKVILSKNFSRIDNLILGSSRAKRIDPKLVSSYLGGDTFNFAVNSASVEDYLGILYFLEKEGKVPKNLLLFFDFYILNSKLPPDPRFLATSELSGFLNGRPAYAIENFLSWGALEQSVATLKNHFSGSAPDQRNRKDGMLLTPKQNRALKKRGSAEGLRLIEKSSSDYFLNKYSWATYDTLSDWRLQLLKKLVAFARKHNIRLYAALTPVHPLHYQNILGHPVLGKTLTRFRQAVRQQFPFRDFMDSPPPYPSPRNWYDAIHYDQEIADWLVKALLDERMSSSEEEK